MPRKPRRSFSAEERATILRRHHVEKVPVAKVCEDADIQPSLFYYWQRQLFENMTSALQPPAAPRSRELEARVQALEKQVAKKDEVIAWVTEEHVKLKKPLGEP